MRRPGRWSSLLLFTGLVLQAPLALGQERPSPSSSYLTPDVRTRLAKAAASPAVAPWQRNLMLELSQSQPESAAVAPLPALPGLALPLSGNAAWSTLAPTGTLPTARYYCSTILDPVRNRIVVFAGVDGLASHGDLWSLSLSGDPAWSAMAPTGNAPSVRYGQTAIYDPRRDRMVVFGGYGARAGSSKEVWALSLSGNPAWSVLAPAGRGPSPRYAHSAIYDPIRDRMIAFGGYDGFSPRRDAWAMSLSGSPAWSALTPAGIRPSARYGQTASYDSLDDRMVVLGGRNDQAAINEVWALSLSKSPAWSRLVPPSAKKPSAKKPSASTPSAHHARPFMFNLEGGLAVPSGDFANPDKLDAQSGFQIGGSVDRRITNWVAVGANGSYSRNKSGAEGSTQTVSGPGGPVTATLTEDKFTTTQLGIHARFFFPTGDGPASLWALLGMGGYRIKENWTVSYSDGEPSTTDEGKNKTGIRPGGKIGMGADYKVSKRLSVGVGADFNLIMVGEQEANDAFNQDVGLFQYTSVHAGVTYHTASK